MQAHDGPAVPARPTTVVDYSAFQDPPSPLFRDYLTGAGRAGRFYEGGRWDADGLLASADRALGLHRDRDALSRALVVQQEARGASEAARRARELAQPDAVAVVTGQQAVLFGGPLYVLYKALAAVRLAAVLEQRRGRPVVPVFWVASDDHDFAEVRSTAVLDEGGQIHTLRYTPAREPVGQPASRVLLDETIGPLIEELSRSLPPSADRDGVVARVTRCYRPGVSLSDAFARLLSSLIPGLVVLDPSDPVLKALAAPILARELEERSPTSRLAEEVGRELLAAGYHQQVPVRQGFLSLFLLDAERRALAFEDGTIEVRGTDRRMPLAEALRHVAKKPEAWSPGVLLRPLAQDHMLPTAVYVGGPAEIAYHAQIGPSYPHFGVPRPTLVPRPSLTLVEPAQARALEAEGLSLSDLQGDPEAVRGRWAREAYPEVEAAFARAREALEREMTAVADVLGQLDPTLRGAAESALGRALHPIQTLHEKSTRALKKRDQSRAERLRRTRDALLPGGSLQERGLGLVSLLARHGEGIVDEIGARMDPWAQGHQVLYL
ncbi:MAG TPA: bacillithiol biosynthesis cysteine-adding enzyme BshC [Vicinamibacteria bacterium]|nr:bacillithiol biosynthesis cysteine-adding enzyme BshC [Vicinamibacteria bacterium]